MVVCQCATRRQGSHGVHDRRGPTAHQQSRSPTVLGAVPCRDRTRSRDDGLGGWPAATARRRRGHGRVIGFCLPQLGRCRRRRPHAGSIVRPRVNSRVPVGDPGSRGAHRRSARWRAERVGRRHTRQRTAVMWRPACVITSAKAVGHKARFGPGATSGARKFRDRRRRHGQPEGATRTRASTAQRWKRTKRSTASLSCAE